LYSVQIRQPITDVHTKHSRSRKGRLLRLQRELLNMHRLVAAGVMRKDMARYGDVRWRSLPSHASRGQREISIDLNGIGDVALRASPFHLHRAADACVKTQVTVVLGSDVHDGSQRHAAQRGIYVRV
jgi:hypothetical protein